MIALPLYDDPPVASLRLTPQAPQSFAFWAGFSVGRNENPRSRLYDPDDEVQRYYDDGHRLGRLVSEAWKTSTQRVRKTLVAAHEGGSR